MDLVFTPSVTVLCQNVEIMDDSVVEDTESFFVSVDSSDPVTLSAQLATVSILDNQDRTFDLHTIIIELVPVTIVISSFNYFT